MSVSLENHIYSPAQYANYQPSFHSRIEALQKARASALQSNPHAPSIAILGGGPAGLCRAIDALISGNQVAVFEKRSKEAHGRENTVALKEKTVPLLQHYGVYPYLLEKKLIFPIKKGDNTFNVRLKDLEEAMKAVIEKLSENNAITYGAQAEKLVSHANGKADLMVKTTTNDQITLNALDLIVVAEGARGTTNEKLLGNRRVSVLPSIPVIAAIFKDHRPKITGVWTCMQYVGKSFVYSIISFVHHTRFLFSFIFLRQHFGNPDRRIAGSIILSTPRQNYVGCGLSKAETEKMQGILKAVEKAQIELENAKKNGSPADQLARFEKNVKKAQMEKTAYLAHCTAMAFCCANMINFLSFIFREANWRWESWLPLENTSIAEIGADYSENTAGMIDKTAYLIAGDTMATVDPTTGLGCTTAIQTVTDFHCFIEGLNAQKNDAADLLTQYNARASSVINDNHTVSKRMRKLYRPDALTV